MEWGKLLSVKTQVFPLDKSDFVRTRLTHSIEASSIAKQLAKDKFSFKGKPVRELFNSQMINDLCGFEGNAQALRILSKVSGSPDGTVSRHPLTFLMEAADYIAYATSDIEDAFKKDMFTVEQFIEYFREEIEYSCIYDEMKRSKTEELISDLEEQMALSVGTKETDSIAFRKWINKVRSWLMYVVSFSFHKRHDRFIRQEFVSRA